MSDLQVIEGDDLCDAVLAELTALWDAAFEGDFTAEDAAHALGGVHVVLRAQGRIVSHASAVPRTIWIAERPHAAGYVEAVATAPDRQGRGLGTRVMERLGVELAERFEIGVLSTGAPGFYERLGWERWAGPSYVVGEGRRTRTEDEDDGLMVLRLGARDLNPTSAIACLDRPGDAW